MIPAIEKDYVNLTKVSNFAHYKIDCDATPDLKFYFDCRIEPQFLILLNGSETGRIVGYNFEKIEATMQKVMDLH